MMTMNFQNEVEARFRVISDNDYSGDPDGVVQLAHHLLSPSVDLRAVVGSELASYDPSYTPTSARDAVVAACEVAELAGRPDVRIVEGANAPLQDRSTAQPSPAVDLIVEEAMRDDTTLPLFVTCGGGLTNIASAWLQDRRIAQRLTLVWIGGPEHPELASPLETLLPAEYNLSIDPLAAQVVFNDSDFDVWQVPRDAYRQVLASRSELLTRLRSAGALGKHLFSALEAIREPLSAFGLRIGETFVLGDNPLVLLTALLSSFDPAPSSCRWVERPRPSIGPDGLYEPSTSDCTIRIYTDLDCRLLLEDLYAKLRLAAG
jgi:inosine-uridine nucleoside N-ribohydrolase